MLCFHTYFSMQNSLWRELLVNEYVSSQGVMGRKQLVGDQGGSPVGLGWS